MLQVAQHMQGQGSTSNSTKIKLRKIPLKEQQKENQSPFSFAVDNYLKQENKVISPCDQEVTRSTSNSIAVCLLNYVPSMTPAH